jgi:hypothetical protein
VASGEWEIVLTADGLSWRPSLFRWLDERFVEEVPGQGLQLVCPGQPERYPYAASSFTAAGAFSNPSRGLDQLLSCSTLTWTGVWHLGSGQVVVVQGPGQTPPSRGRALVIFCNTGDVASAGAALRAENQAAKLSGKRKSV